MRATTIPFLTRRALLTIPLAIPLAAALTLVVACQPEEELADASTDAQETTSAVPSSGSDNPGGQEVAEEVAAPLPFSMPVPAGWRTETIPFPLSFAPDLPYQGIEELRFAPGMFEAESETFWSYGFAWWIRDEDPSDAASLGEHLETYFRGLAGGDPSFEQATFEVALEESDDRGVVGTAHILDSFTTHEQVRLNVQVQRLPCWSVGRQLVFFALSPQGQDHRVWDELASIRAGMECIEQPAG